MNALSMLKIGTSNLSNDDITAYVNDDDARALIPIVDGLYFCYIITAFNKEFPHASCIHGVSRIR
jgi:hypothetical protein